jgi:aspartate/methionine/tyrosine aminotransferase
MVEKFDERRQYCLGRLEKMTEYCTYHRPNGAFYFFVNFSKFLNKVGKSDAEMCKELLSDHHVAIIPGSAFGKEKFVRISYANNIENLKKAFDRIEAYLKK